jgi:hypothetical protein
MINQSVVPGEVTDRKSFGDHSAQRGTDLGGGVAVSALRTSSTVGSLKIGLAN